MTGTRSPLTLPKWGMNMVEATLTVWHKSVGDHVVEGEEIAEIETDKVDTTLESPVTGTIVEIVVDEGEDAEVGDVLAYIEADA
jgi:pyruvate/2-oxoglutarate dehydrogenase complex dihydrolipoamide acyltransferase (E2) component